MSVHWLLLVLHDESAKVIHVYSMKSNDYGTTAKFTALLFCLGKKKQNREQIRKTISQLEDVFEKFTLFQSILALSYIFEPNMSKK